MADEIRAEVRLRAVKGAVYQDRGKAVADIDMAGTTANAGAFVCPVAAHAAFPLGDVTDADKGLCLLANPADSAGDIQLGVEDSDTSFTPLLRLKKGGAPQLMEFDTAAAVQWKAVTADTTVEVILLEA